MARQEANLESYIFGSLGDGYRINGDPAKTLMFGVGIWAGSRALKVLKMNRLVSKAFEGSVEAIVAGVDIVNK